MCGSSALLLLQAHNSCEEAAAHLLCSLWQIRSQPGKVNQSCTDASRCLSDNASWPDEFCDAGTSRLGCECMVMQPMGCIKECELA